MYGKYINKILYSFLWYGSFVLFGITFGLILYPLLASAEELVTDDFDSYTIGTNVTGQGPWVQSVRCGTSQARAALDDITPYSWPNAIRLDAELQGTSTCITASSTNKTDGTLSYKFRVNDIYRTGYANDTWQFYLTQNEDGSGASISYYIGVRVDDLTQYNLKFCTTGTTLNSGCTYDSGYLSLDEWHTVTVRWNDTDSKFYVSLDGAAETAVVTVSATYSYLQTVTLQTRNNAAQTIVDEVGYGSVQGPVLPATSMISNGIPVRLSYGNSSTSDVKLDVYLAQADYDMYDDFIVDTLCSVSPYDMIFGLFKDGPAVIQSSFNDLKAYCSAEETCTLTLNLSLVDDKQYDCHSYLKTDGFLWLSDTLDQYNWSFYTFESSSTPAAIAHRQRVLDSMADTNTTGTSTDPTNDPFGQCVWGNLSIYNCVLLPAKFAVVPTDIDAAENAKLLHNAVFSYFPFSAFEQIGDTLTASVASSTQGGVVVTEFPDINIQFEDYSGTTTTVTFLSGATFTQSWGEFPIVNDLREILEALLYVVFMVLLFNRLRSLIPSPEAVKTI